MTRLHTRTGRETGDSPLGLGGSRTGPAVAWITLPLLSLSIIAGCEQAKSSQSPPASAVKVEVDIPDEKEVTDYHDFTGRVEAVDSVEIRAQVSGYLKRIAFDPSLKTNAEVKAGDLLFEIDERPYQNALDRANAEQAHAEASLKTSSAELARTELLFKKDAVTQSELDRDTGRKLQAEASVASAKASIAQAKLDLEFTQITAPFGGRVSRAIPSVGDLITPSIGTLTTIVSVDPMHVYFDMDEPTLLAVQRQLRAGKLKGADQVEIPLLVGLTDDEGYPLHGKLDFIENQVDPNTGTLRVRGEFPNPKPEVGPRVLSPGLFARVRLPLGDPHKAILVPERAIGRDQGAAFLYVIGTDKEVIYRPVKLGALHDGKRVIEEGLTSGETIVVNGLQRILPGMKVDPQPVKKTESEAHH